VGIVYVLPQTELVMDIDIERTVLTPGSFAELAEDFGLPKPEEHCQDGNLGEKEADGRYSCTSTITKAELQAMGVPDRTQRFHVRIIKERKAVDRSLNFTLSEDGRITKGDAHVYDRSAEVGLSVTTKVLEMAAKVAGAFFGIAQAPDEALPKYCGGNGGNSGNGGNGGNGANGSSQPQEGPTLEQKKMACVSYKRLKTLQGNRDALVDDLNEDTVSTASSMLKILDEEISVLAGLFSVTTTKTIQTVQRRFIPQPEIPPKPEILLKTFYVTNRGELVEEELPQKPKLTLEVRAATDSAPPAFGKKCGARKGDGLVYRLPQSGLAYVTREKKGTEKKRLQTNLDALGTATEALAGAVAQDPELKALENEKALLEAEKDKLEAERQLNCYRQTSEPCSDE
jgi:hypothetical protein